jgi:hypothetical protein
MFPIEPPARVPIERLGVPPAADDTTTRQEEIEEARRRDEAKRANDRRSTFDEHLNTLLPPGWAALTSAEALALPEIRLTDLGIAPGVQGYVRSEWQLRLADPQQTSELQEATSMPLLIPLAPQPTSVDPQALLEAVSEGRAVDVSFLPNVLMAQLTQLRQGGQPVSQLALRLNPEHLGPLNMTVVAEGGKVSVQLAAASESTRHVLESQLEDIKAILVAHQIAPGELKVTAPPKGGQSSGGRSSKDEDAYPTPNRWVARRPSKPDDAVEVAV